MATYVIGDVQGCFGPLQALLGAIRFNTGEDRLWFAGDLVNRGPESLAVLRFVRGLGDAAVSVLGNHDLHLLAVAAGAARLKPRDTLTEILAASDRETLLTWLRGRPLFHDDDTLGWACVHAGLLPAWDLAQARALAREARAALQGADHAGVLARMYGNEPAAWDDALTGEARLRVIINALTRLRFCTPAGAMRLNEKGAPGSQPPEAVPWFAIKGRKTAGARVVFGHWSALGAGRHVGAGAGVAISLDSGCVWRRALTAFRLDDQRFFSVPCSGDAPAPHAATH